MKSGPFAEHSNILWGISSVAAWEKVNSGLIKMYKVEVTGQIVSLSILLSKEISWQFKDSFHLSSSSSHWHLPEKHFSYLSISRSAKKLVKDLPIEANTL